MELRKEIIEKILLEMDIGLIAFNRAPRDVNYEYKLTGITFYEVACLKDGEWEGFDVYSREIARLFEYDFIKNVHDDYKAEATYIHQKREKLRDAFEKGDDRGYNDFISRVDERIKPYQNTDSRVTASIWKLFESAKSAYDKEKIDLNEEDFYNYGYNNGVIRKVQEIICYHPEMFVDYPNLLFIHKAVDHTRNYYFRDIFWSSAAYKEAVKALAAEEFLSEDGQSWLYKLKGSKTIFIALFEVLYTKDYLQRRLTTQEIRSIAKNSFGIDISERTFNEGAAIIKAQGSLKFIPTHIRYLTDDPKEEEKYRRR